MCKEKTMTNFKTSSWYVDANGVAQPQTTKYHEDRYEAERQYHLFCAAAATSAYPTHVALLETIDGIKIKRECYKHEVDG
jgi:hypothetical protein